MQLPVPKKVVVVGAGIMGLSTALHLQKKGISAYLIDAASPGAADAASYGNAGVLASSSMLPINSPGVEKKLPEFLRDPLGPVRLDWGYVMMKFPWFMSYIKHSKPGVVDHTIDGLCQMVADSWEEHQTLAKNTPAGELLHTSPYVFLYPSEADFQGDSFAWEMRRAHDYPFDVWQIAELHEKVPGLNPNINIGVACHHQHGHCESPAKYMQLLSEHFLALGGEFQQAKVSGLVAEAGRVTGVQLGDQSVSADAVVVAAGARSAPILQSIGVQVPLISERGYHQMFLEPQHRPQFPLMWTKGKCVFTPMQGGVRLAGCAEFANIDKESNEAFAERLVSHAEYVFPQWRYEQRETWLGHRPALPDSLPAIGRVPAFSNVLCAFGHHHVGLTSGPKTGRWISELLASGEETLPELGCYNPARL